MLQNVPSFWVLSLLCSIAGATMGTGSATFQNTTSITSLHSTIGRTVSTNVLTSTVASGSRNSAISVLNAIPQPSIQTSTITQSGTTQLIAILSGGSIATPITFPIPTTTITSNSPDLSTSVASVSSQIVGLYPALSSWASAPEPAKATPIIGEITGVVGGIAALLGSLPHGGGGGGGGLFGSLIISLGSIVNGLEQIKGNLPIIGSAAVASVLGALEGVQSDTEELEEEEDEDDPTSVSKSQGPTSKPHSTTLRTHTSAVSSCTSTITGFDTHVTCTEITSTGLSTTSVSTSCETSTSTTVGCDVTTTAVTTIVTGSSCPLRASISADYLSERAAAGTVVSGTTYPLALWPTEPPSGSSITPISTPTLVSSVPNVITSSTAAAHITTISAIATTSAAPTGPTGFHVVALKCTDECDDALEIVPSANDDCTSIAQNQPTWWGAAFPPGPAQTENNANQIPPFSLLSNNQFTVYYVFDNTGFSSQLCGLDKLNITFINADGGWSWENTDNHSGTCIDNSGVASSSCNLQRQSDGDQETYTMQEQLLCVDPNNPTYCAA